MTLHLAASVALRQVAVEGERAGAIGPELEHHGLTRARAFHDPVFVQRETVGHVPRGEGDLDEIVLLDFDAGRGVGELIPLDRELPNLTLRAGRGSGPDCGGQPEARERKHAHAPAMQTSHVDYLPRDIDTVTSTDAREGRLVVASLPTGPRGQSFLAVSRRPSSRRGCWPSSGWSRALRLSRILPE